jgi:hypothetical protein
MPSMPDLSETEMAPLRLIESRCALSRSPPAEVEGVATTQLGGIVVVPKLILLPSLFRSRPFPLLYADDASPLQADFPARRDRLRLRGRAMPTLSQVLSRYGISSRILAHIEPHRDDQGTWRIKFSAPGNPAGVSVDLAGASKLTAELRGISEMALAERIDAAVSKAKSFAKSPFPR